MTAGAAPTAPQFDWEAAGRELGATLDRLHAIAVLGTNENETAQVALGIARQQARKRRVAIGDLLGDAEPLATLVPSDDPHGLADVFEYGLSLDRVARRVDGDQELFILPTGSFMTDHAEIMANRRWSRLARGFREQQGLLIIAASAATPEIQELVFQLEGAVLVGDMVPAKLPRARVLGAIKGPPRPSRPIRRVTPPRPKFVIRGRRSLWRMGGMVGVTLAAVIAALGFWLASRPLASSTWAPLWLQRGREGRVDSNNALLRPADSAAAPADSGLRLAPGLGLLTKQDSAAVAPYGIALVTFNTQAGALLELERNGASLRAGTFTPVLIRETPWFRVVAGAYPDSASAAALLDTLRARGMSDAGRARIERFPYALLVERDVPDTAVASRVSVYQTRGLPVYALLQTDGTARVYAGAFKTPEEAASLFETLRSSGVSTSLVFRTGRVY